MMKNMKKLGETLMGNMQNVARSNSNIVSELGTITAKMGLQVPSLGNEIPKGDYLVSIHLKAGEAGSVMAKTATGQGTHPHGPSGSHSQESGSGSHSHPASEGAHVHDVLLPATLRGLAPGDRVLVIWCGNEPVVADILQSS